MIILGLHFGHDSSITVLKDGKILTCVELERKYRIKHLIGLTHKDIMEVLLFTHLDFKMFMIPIPIKW